MKERMTEIIGMQIQMLQSAVPMLDVDELTTMSAWLGQAINSLPAEYISGDVR